MKNLSYFLSSFCVLFFFTTCSPKQKSPAFDENMINIISENPIYSGNSDIPLEYAFTTFFVQGDSGKILLLDPREMEEIYNEDYSSWNYKKFLRKAFNQKLIIKAKSKGKVFELDKEVTDNYLNNDFPNFLKIYCDTTQKDDKFWMKIDVQEQKRTSIFYYFFINNYLAWFDDISGAYIILKTSRYTNRLN